MSGKEPRLGAIAAVKFVALLFLYWWHCPLPKPGVGLGGTMSTFLFVASGFLVAYNYLNRDFVVSPAGCLRYGLCKFLTVWPLHLVLFAVCAYFLNGNLLASATGRDIALKNVFLLQAWFPRREYAFSFNGVSWFLSALLPCYLLALPLVAFCRCRLQATVAFLTFSALYVWLVFCVRTGDWPTPVIMQTYPVYRMLQFGIGLSGCGALRDAAELLRHRGKAAGVFECVGLTLFLGSSWWIGDIHSLLFPLLFLGVLMVFSSNSGLVSRVLSVRPVQVVVSCQFEFFLIHQVVIRMFSHFFHRWIMAQLHAGRHAICVAYILTEAVLAVALSLAWHSLFAKSTKRVADKISRLVFPLTSKVPNKKASCI